MGLYQYLEFQALDRRLDENDRKALRRLSSRADITATSFSNEYHFGDFHGNPGRMMERWFDLHLHYMGWGARRLMMRVPKPVPDRSTLKECLREVDEAKVWETAEHLIVDIQFHRDEWMGDDPEPPFEGLLEKFVPLRSDVAGGDLRLFYVLWLTAIEKEFLRDETEEPLPGIGPLSEPLEEFAQFFGVDQDLVAAAAETGETLAAGQTVDESTREVITSIPEAEKDALLLRLANGDPRVATELRHRVRMAWKANSGQSGLRRRKVRELRERSLVIREERRAEEASRREAARLQREREARRKEQARLDSVRRRGARAWDDVEQEIQRVNRDGYRKAVSLLVDLRAIAQQTGNIGAFNTKVKGIRSKHSRKELFRRVLDEERLGLD